MRPPRCMSAAALSAAVDSYNWQGTTPTSHGCASPQEKPSLFPATLRERGSGGEALLLEKRPLPRRPYVISMRPSRCMSAAALSAAVNSYDWQGTTPTSHGCASSQEKPSLFPATLRERGSGGEALLLEKRPLPREALRYLYASPTLHVRGGSVSRRGLIRLAGNHTHLAWARKSVGKTKPIPSYSSGEGVWGRGASLREAASPPRGLTLSLPCFPCRCGTCRWSASGGGGIGRRRGRRGRW